MSNILKNPELGNWKHDRYVFEERNPEKHITIELPEHWEYYHIPRETDSGIIAESLHKDNGFELKAGWRKWEGGYVQRGVQLEANTRYQAKVHFFLDMSFSNNQVDLTAITWRFRVVGPSAAIEQDWTALSDMGINQPKTDVTHSLVFESKEALTVDLYFVGRSVFAGNVASLLIRSITLEPVGTNVGGTVVPSIGSESAVPSTNTPAKESPAVRTRTESSPATNTVTGPSGKTLAQVLSAEDVDTIVIGLRKLAQQRDTTEAITNGLNKLADGIEKLK